MSDGRKENTSALSPAGAATRVRGPRGYGRDAPQQYFLWRSTLQMLAKRFDQLTSPCEKMAITRKTLPIFHVSCLQASDSTGWRHYRVERSKQGTVLGSMDSPGQPARTKGRHSQAEAANKAKPPSISRKRWTLHKHTNYR
ncbi:hypothetical protein RRG08_009718 [Elysia crispata]|uniref:Uncharacterized protein n=1 Tax=Elysia crispata TaxID=231223 RepID=A0AAE1CU59_9GAST|nr:hypothetical protein RRG08_009718 [Elysia crispata]